MVHRDKYTKIDQHAMLLVEKLPSERASRPAQLNCGTCCCCCCLHSAASIAGAVMLSGKRGEVEDETQRRCRRGTLSDYWTMFFVATAGIYLFFRLATQRGLFGEGWLGALIFLGALPAIQIAVAAVLVLFYAVVARKDYGSRLRILGRLSSGAVLGVIAGIIAMIVLAKCWAVLGWMTRGF